MRHIKPVAFGCGCLCCLFACSQAPHDNEVEALRRENAALKAQNAELTNKLTEAHAPPPEAHSPSTQKPLPVTDTQASAETKPGPPDSFRDIVAYADASAKYTMYFILVDKNGQPTTVSGRVQVNIKGPLDVYKKDYDVSPSDFTIFTRGRGALEERVLGCVLPSVSKYDFIYDPIQRYGETSGTIYMRLYVGGSLWFSGEASILFK